MTGAATSLAGGLMLGLASSFHCACMCGGMASGALFILNPRTPTERGWTLALLQMGRITTYAIGGAVLAGVAGLSLGPATTAASYKLLQWLSAGILTWVGLSTAGVLPAVSLPGSSGGLAAASARVLSAFRRRPRLMPVAAGMGWGLTPCPMVYAALIPAMLSGSAANGFAWMAGFGVGTAPAVIGAALSVSAVAEVRRSRVARIVAGLAVASFGVFSAIRDFPALAAWCGLA